MSVVLGIDLGTTNSCAAYVSNNVPRIVPTDGDFTTLPSIVGFLPGGDVVIGQQAREQLPLNPLGSIHGSKRLFGRHYKSQYVQRLIEYFNYEVIPGKNGLAAVKVKGREYPLVEIHGMILRHMKRHAEIHLGDDCRDVVIAVPAYYSGVQREAVRQAATYAEFNVLRLVNEPTAAALAHGFNRSFDKRILVYDLGGGTFDVSLLELADNVFEVVATGGDTQLGGVDFDNRIIDHLVKLLQDKERMDVSNDNSALQQLRSAAERAKIELSLLANTELHLSGISERKGRPADVSLVLTRETLNDLVRDLVERSLAVTDQVLARQGRTVADVDDVILVGGQTRMPLIADMLSAHVGKSPRKGVQPEESVALGAALLGESLGSIDSVTLLDVLSVPISLAQADGKLRTVIEGNVRLPYHTEVELALDDELKHSVVDVFQGEGTRVEQVEYLGSFDCRACPTDSDGQAGVRVALTLTAEGILKIVWASQAEKDAAPVELQVLDSPASLAQPQAPVERVSDQALADRQKQEESGSLSGFVRGLFGK